MNEYLISEAPIDPPWVFSLLICQGSKAVRAINADSQSGRTMICFSAISIDIKDLAERLFAAPLEAESVYSSKKNIKNSQTVRIVRFILQILQSKVQVQMTSYDVQSADERQ